MLLLNHKREDDVRLHSPFYFLTLLKTQKAGCILYNLFRIVKTKQASFWDHHRLVQCLEFVI